jgi:dTDP-4-dehydrorhamnose 3,5-epimerase
MNTDTPYPHITPFDAKPTAIDGLYIITMKQIEDERGTIRELFRGSALEGAGISGLGDWKQINATETKQGGIRGLHGEDMVKLVAVVHGEAFGAYVDIRPNSPTKGKVVTVQLAKGTQVLVPQGVCNGFQSVSEGTTQYLYCFSAEWQPGMKGYAVNPLDPALAIQWPIIPDPANRLQVSEKDAKAPSLEEAMQLAAA